MLRQSKQGSSHQKKVQFNQSAKKVFTNDSIGTFSPDLYILYLVKLPAPPRADLCYLIDKPDMDPMGYINSTIIPNEPPAVRMLCAWLVAFLELVAMVARPNLLMVHI